MSRTYSEKEMYIEIKNYIEGLGGILHELDVSRQIVDMEIDPAYEEEVLAFLEEIIVLYTVRREELRRTNPFFGVMDMVENLAEDDGDDDGSD